MIFLARSPKRCDGSREHDASWSLPGASPQDHATENRLRSEVPAVEGNVKTEYWSGLPLAVLQSQLAALRSDAVVFTPGFWQDGGGKAFNPRDAAALMARASAAPVYGPFDTFIGTGIVGGRMPSFEEMGRQAGDTVRQSLPVLHQVRCSCRTQPGRPCILIGAKHSAGESTRA